MFFLKTSPVAPVGVCRKWHINSDLIFKVFKSKIFKQLIISSLRQTPTGGVFVMNFIYLSNNYLSE